jgi:hypothetical protein
VTVASARADRSGRFDFVIRPRHAGRASYRVRLAASATNVAGTSPSRTLRTT